MLSSEFLQFVSRGSWMASLCSALAVVVLLCLGTIYVYISSGNLDVNKIYVLRGLSLVHAWSFFNERFDFLRSNFDKTGHELFAFKVLHVSSWQDFFMFRK
jgi:hypothetical protein